LNCLPLKWQVNTNYYKHSWPYLVHGLLIQVDINSKISGILNKYYFSFLSYNYVRQYFRCVIPISRLLILSILVSGSGLCLECHFFYNFIATTPKYQLFIKIRFLVFKRTCLFFPFWNSVCSIRTVAIQFRADSSGMVPHAISSQG